MPAPPVNPSRGFLTSTKSSRRPTSKLPDLRRRFGDPDRVVEGPDPGTKIWVFDKAGVTVRSKNGEIYSVEVY